MVREVPRRAGAVVAVLAGGAIWAGCGEGTPAAAPVPPRTASTPAPASPIAPPARSRADRSASVVVLLRKYARAYAARDAGTLQGLLAASVTTRQPAAGGCAQASGAASVLPMLSNGATFAARRLVVAGLDPSDVRLSRRHAFADLAYTGRRRGTMHFRMLHAGDRWTVDRIWSRCVTRAHASPAPAPPPPVPSGAGPSTVHPRAGCKVVLRPQSGGGVVPQVSPKALRALCRGPR